MSDRVECLGQMLLSEKGSLECPRLKSRSISEGWPPLAHCRQLEMVAGRERSAGHQSGTKAANSSEKMPEDDCRAGLEDTRSVKHRGGIARAERPPPMATESVRIY